MEISDVNKHIKSIHPFLLIREIPNKAATSDPSNKGHFSDTSASFSEYVSLKGTETFYFILTHVESYLCCKFSFPIYTVSFSNCFLSSHSRQGPTLGFFKRLKILQARLQEYVNHELPDVQAGFRKGRGTRDQIANVRWIMEKAREFQENIYFCFIDYAKAFDCVHHNKLWKILKDGNT